MQRGRIFIISAPSGTGKTTLVERLVKVVPDMVISRSYTSRRPRPGEVDGVDYNFINSQQFATMVDANEFLECATIFGYDYGTSLADTERERRAGRDVVLVINVQGADQVSRQASDMVGIFVTPPSSDVLEARLRRRSGEHATESELRRRLDAARGEVEARDRYDYVIVNYDVEQCVDLLRCIVMAERSRVGAMSGATANIADTFRTKTADT